MGTRWPGTTRRIWWSVKVLMIWATSIALIVGLMALPVAIALQATRGHGLLAMPLTAATLAFLTTFTVSLRDKIRRHRRENARPVEDRITEIRLAAASRIDALPGLRDQLRANYPDRPRAWNWIGPVIDYDRRLEALAASFDSSPKDALKLAEEAHRFLRRNRVKGVLIADLAYRLSTLLEQRHSTGIGQF